MFGKGTPMPAPLHEELNTQQHLFLNSMMFDKPTSTNTEGRKQAQDKGLSGYEMDESKLLGTLTKNWSFYKPISDNVADRLYYIEMQRTRE